MINGTRFLLSGTLWANWKDNRWTYIVGTWWQVLWSKSMMLWEHREIFVTQNSHHLFTSLFYMFVTSLGCYQLDKSFQLVQAHSCWVGCSLASQGWTQRGRLVIFPSPAGCCCYSVTKLGLTLCDPVDCGTPGFPVLHCLPEFAQVHVCWVSDTT